MYLSFQNGTDTASTSQQITVWLLQLLGVDVNDWSTMSLWDHRLRVAAHGVVFYIYGMFGALVLDKTCFHRRFWMVIFVLSGVALAVWSEIGKVQMEIPGRHCNTGEMMLNLAGFLAGFLLNLGLEKIIDTIRQIKKPD